MGKKIASLMQEEQSSFVAGAIEQGYPEALAGDVWNLIEPFAGYAFNKAHSVSYALIAYWTAYFKANYPVEFMAAQLTGFQGSTEKIGTTIAECRRLGISVLPPDVNQANVGFSIDRQPDGKNAIRFSLAAVKNVGESAVRPIIEEREANGPYTGVEDFCRRARLGGMNRRTLESLVKVGALSSVGPMSGLLENLDRILSIAQQQALLRKTGQTTMFDLFGDSVAVPLPEIELADSEVPEKERLQWQWELLGAFLDDHPLAKASERLGEEITPCSQIEPEMEGQTVLLAGKVSAVRPLQTCKEGKAFAAVTLEDLHGNVEVTVWPNIYEKTSHLLRAEEMLVVRGRVRLNQDRVSVAASTVERFDDVVAERAAAASTSELAAEAPLALDAPASEQPPGAVSANGAAPAGGEPIPMGPGGETVGEPASPPMPEAVSTDPETEAAGELAQPPFAEADAAAEREPANPTEPVAETPAVEPDAVGPRLEEAPGPAGSFATNGAPVEDPAEGLVLHSGNSESLRITLRETVDRDADLAQLRRLIAALKEHPGGQKVRLTLHSGDSPTEVELAETVAFDDALLQELARLVGKDAVHVA